jgi:hypothetical protein
VRLPAIWRENDLAQLNDNIQKPIDIGVVEINLEVAQGEGIYLRLDSPLERTQKRAELYVDAGAKNASREVFQILSTIQDSNLKPSDP